MDIITSVVAFKKGLRFIMDHLLNLEAKSVENDWKDKEEERTLPTELVIT